MPYNRLPQKAANSLLGPGTLNSMRRNTSFNQNLIRGEHIVTTGEHNAYEVSRVCRRITTTPSVSPTSTDGITAVTNPSAGRFVLTLAASRFETDMIVDVNVLPEAIKPHIATVKIVSATSIEVFTQRLTSTLGSAGNVWGLVDTAFDISIHSRPLYPEDWTYGIPRVYGRNDVNNGYGLAGGGSNVTPSGWSLLVANQADLYAKMTAEHTSAGAHNVRQVAEASAYLDFDGTKYDYVRGNDGSDPFTSTTRVSTGVVQLNHASWTTPVSSFVSVDFERANGQARVPYIVNAIDTSATVTTVYCFKWDAANSWWIADDCDFWISLHK